MIVPRDLVEATDQREQFSSLWDIETHFGEVTDAASLMARYNPAASTVRG